MDETSGLTRYYAIRNNVYDLGSEALSYGWNEHHEHHGRLKEMTVMWKHES